MNVQPRVALRRKPPPAPASEFGLRTHMAMLQGHLLRGRPPDLICVQTIAQTIAGLAPSARLFETAKRVRTLLIFVRSILSRDGVATDEERAVLQRAFDRLIVAAAEEGTLEEA